MNTTDRILGEAMTPYQKRKRIHLDAEKATAWATKHQQRFPEAEAAIANDPLWAYSYASQVLKGRWPEGEPAIATNSFTALYYAKDVIKGPWPEGEPAIATNPGHVYLYARDILKDRFPEGEAAFANNPEKPHPLGIGQWGRLFSNSGNATQAYLKLFPEARLKFVMNGWIDWLDL
jgi:hypothetical protein